MFWTRDVTEIIFLDFFNGTLICCNALLVASNDIDVFLCKNTTCATNQGFKN